MPMLEKANIASIGADAITPYDAKSPASFLFDAGVPGYAAMPAIAVKNLGATRLAGVHLDAPTAGTNQEFFQMGVGLAGAEMVDNIVIPIDAIDYSQFVSRAEGKGADAIVSSLSPEANLKLWKALGASGSKLKVVASAGSVTPGVAKEAGELAEGSYVVAGTPTPDESNEWGMEYIAAMKEYEPGETVYAGVGLRAYEAVRLFKEVAQTIDGDIDNQSVFDAFGKVNGLKFAWIESLSFDKDGPIKDLPRVVSSVTFPAKIVNGQFVAEGAFDPFAN